MINKRASVNSITYTGAKIKARVHNKNSGKTYTKVYKVNANYTGTSTRIMTKLLKGTDEELLEVFSPATFTFKVNLGPDNNTYEHDINGITNILNASKFKKQYNWYGKKQYAEVYTDASNRAKNMLSQTLANEKYSGTKYLNIGDDSDLLLYKGKEPVPPMKYQGLSVDERATYIIKTYPEYVQLAQESLEKAINDLKNLGGKITGDLPKKSDVILERIMKSLSVSGWAIFRANRLYAQIPMLVKAKDLDPNLAQDLLDIQYGDLTVDDLFHELEALKNYDWGEREPFYKDEQERLFELFQKRAEIKKDLQSSDAAVKEAAQAQADEYEQLYKKYKRSKCIIHTDVPDDVRTILSTLFSASRNVDATGAMVLPVDTKTELKKYIESSGYSKNTDYQGVPMEELLHEVDAYKELSAHNISDKEALLGVLTKIGLKSQNLELRYQSIFQALSKGEAKLYEEDTESGNLPYFIVKDLKNVSDVEDMDTLLMYYKDILNKISEKKKLVDAKLTSGDTEFKEEYKHVLSGDYGEVKDPVLYDYLSTLINYGNGETPERVNKYLTTWEKYLAEQTKRVEKLYAKEDAKQQTGTKPESSTVDEQYFGKEYNVDNLTEYIETKAKAYNAAVELLNADSNEDVVADDNTNEIHEDWKESVDALLDLDRFFSSQNIPEATASSDEVLSAFHKNTTNKSEKEQFVKFFKFRKIIQEVLNKFGIVRKEISGGLIGSKLLKEYESIKSIVESVLSGKTKPSLEEAEQLKDKIGDCLTIFFAIENKTEVNDQKRFVSNAINKLKKYQDVIEDFIKKSYGTGGYSVLDKEYDAVKKRREEYNNNKNGLDSSQKIKILQAILWSLYKIKDEIEADTKGATADSDKYSTLYRSVIETIDDVETDRKDVFDEQASAISEKTNNPDNTINPEGLSQGHPDSIDYGETTTPKAK